MKKLITIFVLVGTLLCSMSNTAFAFSKPLTETYNNLNSSREISAQIEDEPIAIVDNQDTNIVQTKVEFTNIIEPVRFELDDELKYDLQFTAVDNFDYMVISFVSTQGVTLNSYKSLTLEYNETVAPISISFDLTNFTSKFDIALNYNEVELEKIFVIFDVIEENRIVQTEKVTISAFFTNHGTFISSYGDIFAYDKYISYLHENNYITDSDVKKAHKKMTELQVIDEKTKSETSVFDFWDSDDLITYFNPKSQSVSSIPAKDYLVISQSKLEGINNSQTVSLMSTSTVGPICPPSVKVTRTIVALSAGEQLQVYGYVQWTDIDGVLHPARNIEVQIMDEDVTFDDAIKTIYTNNNGYYSAIINNQNDAIENGCDIYIRVNLSNDDFEITPNAVSSIFSDGYHITTTVTQNVTTSQQEEISIKVGEDYYGSFSIHQAMVVGYYYYNQMNDGQTNTISIKYPHNKISDSDWNIDYVRISYDDYCDWDVILHELGHQVAAEINVDAFFTDSHSGSQNLMEDYGKAKGIKGSWSEGWATYFSLASQKYFNSYVTTISDIINVADDAYTDLSFEDSGTYKRGLHRDYSTYTGCGEGNEAAVSYVLFYLVYRAGLTHQELWNIAAESACNRFSDFIETLYNSVDKSFYTVIGTLLEEQNIADKPDIRTSIFSRNTPGTFYWTPVDTTDSASGSYQYHNGAVITFFDEDYNIVMESPIHASSSGVYGVTINSALWRVLDLEITGDSFYWCIATSQNDNPATGPYYSTFHKAYFIEDISTIEETNVQYTGYLAAYDDVIYKFVAPTSGDYTFFSSGDTDVNATIYLDSKLEGNDITDDDSGEGLNFLHERYLSAGTTIYLKIGGYRDATGYFSVTAIR